MPDPWADVPPPEPGGGGGSPPPALLSSGPGASAPLTRRERIRAEIEANRRGEYTVPTWVLALALVAMVGAIVLFLALT